MENILSFICEHAHQAYWLIFLLLLLTGFNIPISEDLIVMSAGAIASTCIKDHTVSLFAWTLAGCYLSAWIAYWIGRLIGPRIYTIPFFHRFITPERVDKLRRYFAKFGIWTFIIGRFCPGGIRNAIFISSGLTQMPFPRFILRDGVACPIACSLFFYLGYQFGEHWDVLQHYFYRYTEVMIGLIVLIIIISIIIYRKETKF